MSPATFAAEKSNSPKLAEALAYKPANRRLPRCAGGKAQRATYVALSQAGKSKSRNS